MANGDCTSAYSAFWLLLFDAQDTVERCTNDKAVYAFATLAALSFAAFVIVDVMVFLVRRFGFAATGAGTMAIERTGSGWVVTIRSVAIIGCGMIAAWIVAFFAAIVEFLQMAPQTAVATGVLWQVTYAQLLARFGRDVDEGGGEHAATPTPPPPANVQAPTEEVAEAG